ncbi:hypothetical protein ACQEVZ_46935 [Dactylosporangium sp. CA-152071]|uniref:hypothetical protein n=1 Tax=Dactylosporangium sp. CA-152071 TaxID=3239933 RepID=UPI003D8AD99D
MDTIGLVAGLGQLVFAAIAWRQSVTATGPGTPDHQRLLEAARFLRRQILQQWHEEVGDRRLRHPRPLQLRWENAVPGRPASLTITPGNLVDETTGREPAAALVDAFRRLQHRQLVILGEPGAGKSTVAMLFVLAAAGRDDDPVSVQRPVPVLLSLAAWRADQETLHEWIARRLVEDYPELADAARYGPDAAARLVAERLVLPVLDGLDEMPAGLLPDVFDALNDVAGVGGLQTVVTCRRAEFNAALADVAPLRLAALAVIRPIRVSDSIAFITGEQVDADRWREVVERMRQEPAGPLATALSTPLMTALARAVYERPHTTPAELCALPDVPAIQQHLLDRLLPTVYPAARLPVAERALSFLAAHLQERLATPNLAWWHLARAVPTGVVVWSVAAVIAAVGAAATAYVQPFGYGAAPDALFGAGIGLAAGTVAGLNAARGMTATNTPATGRRRWTGLVGAAARDGLAGALVVCAATGWYFAGRATSGGIGLLYQLIQLLVFGTGLGMALSVVLQGLALGRGSTPNRAAPRPGLLVPRLVSGLGMGLAFGLPAGLTLGVVAGVSERDLRSGLIAGLLTVLVVGATVGLPVGVGRWFATPVEADTPLTPRTVLRGDLISLTVTALSCAVTAGLGDALLTMVTSGMSSGSLVQFAGMSTDSPLEAAPWAALVAFGAVLLGSGAPSVSYMIAHGWLVLWRRLPWRLFMFLEDAHERAILRQLGSVYQFRHARLLERLAAGHRPGRYGRLVETGAEVGAILRGERPPPRRAARLGVTAVAMLVLPALLVTVSFPVARDRLEAAIAAEDSDDAAELIDKADTLQESDPMTALRLRAAAAKLDSDDSSKLDLGSVLDLLATGEVLTWRKAANEIVEGDQWLMFNDADGRGTAWGPADTSAAGPVPLGDTGGLSDMFNDGAWAVSERLPRLVWQLSNPRLESAHIDEEAELSIGPGGWLLCLYPDGRLTVFDARLWPAREVLLATDVTETASDATRWVYAAGRDGTHVRVIDFATEPPRVATLADPTAKLDADASGEVLVTTSAAGAITLWDPADPGRPRYVGAADTDATVSVSGPRLVFVGDRLVDVGTAPARSIEYDDAAAVPGHDDRAVVLSGGVVSVVDFGANPPAWRTVATGVDTIDFDDGDSVLLGSDSSDTTRLLDLTQDPPRVTATGERLMNGDVLADASGNWSVRSRHLPPVYVGPGGQYNSVAVGDEVAVLGQRDGSLRIVRLATGQQRIVPLGGPLASPVYLTDDGRWASVAVAGKIQAVNVSTGELQLMGKRDDYREVRVYRTNGRIGDWIAVWKNPAQPGTTPTLRHVAGDPMVAACRLIQKPLSPHEWRTLVPQLTYVNPCPGA